eukprot:scaffold952_cov249-Pinguiococcus_pyrenoidosus.AAC.32
MQGAARNAWARDLAFGTLDHQKFCSFNISGREPKVGQSISITTEARRDPLHFWRLCASSALSLSAIPLLHACIQSGSSRSRHPRPAAELLKVPRPPSQRRICLLDRLWSAGEAPFPSAESTEQ